MHEVDGHELDGAELAVDASNELVHDSTQVLVLFDILARGNGDLHKDDLADPFRVLSQEDLKSVQFLRHTLDVVQAIDTDDEFDALEFLFEGGDALLNLGLLQTLVELLWVNTNWECADSNDLALEFDTVRCCRKATVRVSMYATLQDNEPTGCASNCSGSGDSSRRCGSRSNRSGVHRAGSRYGLARYGRSRKTGRVCGGKSQS